MALISSSVFAEAFRKIREINFENATASIHQHPRPQSQRNRRQIAVIFKLARLWKEKGNVLLLHGVLKPDKTVATQQDDMSATLAAHWAPTFAKISKSKKAIRQFCKEHVKKWENFSPSPPGISHYKIALAAEDSRPGEDGIPYSAWGACPEEAAITLFGLGCELRRGLSFGIEFNINVCLFLPKGSKEADLQEIIRAPEETRPIGMKNTDVKTITSAENIAVKKEVASHIHHSQRGFVWNRQFVNNIVEIDAVSRCFSLAFPLPLIALFDIKTACPSLFWDWMHAVFEARGFDEGFCCMLEGIYYMVWACSAILQILFAIWSGVIQGCPLSGLAFAVSFDPVGHSMGKIDKIGSSLTRFCADDVGAALSSPEVLRQFHTVFRVFAILTGLEISAKKTVFVICSKNFVLDAGKLREWLAQHLPDWLDATICETGEYLGVWLGPRAASRQFRKPFAKWVARAKEISSFAGSCWMSAQAYNIHCFTIFSYLAQFLVLPQWVLHKEKGLISSLLRIPHNSWGTEGPHMLDELGLVSVKSLAVLNLASLGRAAARTIDWAPSATLLKQYFDAHASILLDHKGNFQEPHWDSQPLALIQEAFGGPEAWSCVGKVKASPGSFLPWLPAICSQAGPLPPDKHHQLLDAQRSEDKPQGLLSAIIHAHFFERFSWTHMLCRRLQAFVARHRLEVGVISHTQVAQAIQVWKVSGKPMVVVNCLRLATNAWLTSTRMPRVYASKACVFNCVHSPNNDKLGHYVNCQPLWSCIEAIVGHPMTPINRLGICNSREVAIAAALATSCYHKLRAAVWGDASDLLSHIFRAAKSFYLALKAPFPEVSQRVVPWGGSMFRGHFGDNLPIVSPMVSSYCRALRIPRVLFGDTEVRTFEIGSNIPSTPAPIASCGLRRTEVRIPDPLPTYTGRAMQVVFATSTLALGRSILRNKPISICQDPLPPKALHCYRRCDMCDFNFCSKDSDHGDDDRHICDPCFERYFLDGTPESDGPAPWISQVSGARPACSFPQCCSRSSQDQCSDSRRRTQCGHFACHKHSRKVRRNSPDRHVVLCVHCSDWDDDDMYDDGDMHTDTRDEAAQDGAHILSCPAPSCDMICPACGARVLRRCEECSGRYCGLCTGNFRYCPPCAEERNRPPPEEIRQIQPDTPDCTTDTCTTHGNHHTHNRMHDEQHNAQHTGTTTHDACEQCNRGRSMWCRQCGLMFCHACALFRRICRQCQLDTSQEDSRAFRGMQSDPSAHDNDEHDSRSIHSNNLNTSMYHEVKGSPLFHNDCEWCKHPRQHQCRRCLDFFCAPCNYRRDMCNACARDADQQQEHDRTRSIHDTHVEDTKVECPANAAQEIFLTSRPPSPSGFSGGTASAPLAASPAQPDRPTSPPGSAPCARVPETRSPGRPTFAETLLDVSHEAWLSRVLRKATARSMTGKVHTHGSTGRDRRQQENQTPLIARAVSGGGGSFFDACVTGAAPPPEGSSNGLVSHFAATTGAESTTLNSLTPGPLASATNARMGQLQ